VKESVASPLKPGLPLTLKFASWKRRLEKSLSYYHKEFNLFPDLGFDQRACCRRTCCSKTSGWNLSSPRKDQKFRFGLLLYFLRDSAVSIATGYGLDD
jgi:DNA-directed RNA polymerase subunit N (RpoN/RPB10)